MGALSSRVGADPFTVGAGGQGAPRAAGTHMWSALRRAATSAARQGEMGNARYGVTVNVAIMPASM
jgi:hypothetical protein